jgi:hypothetical protein
MSLNIPGHEGNKSLLERFHYRPLIMAVITATNLAVSACSKEKSENQPQRTDNVTADEEAPAIMDDYQKKVPQIKEEQREEKFPIPAELDMDKKEFTLFMDALVKKTEDLGKKMETAVAKEGANGRNLIKAFLSELLAEIEKTPKGKDYMESKINNSQNQPEQLAHELSQLFRAYGYYFDVVTEIKNIPQPEIHFAPIENVRHFIISSEKKSYEAPLLVLGEPLIKGQSEAYASWHLKMDASVYYRGQFLKDAEKRYQETQQLDLNPKNIPLEKFIADYEKDSINHELTHHYLSKLYPNITKEMSGILTLPIRIPAPRGGYIESVEKVPAINLHELCAVANELAHSKAELPESLYRYLDLAYASGKVSLMSEKTGYELVNMLLPPLVIFKAPESPMKNELVDRLLLQGKMNMIDLMMLVRDTYTVERVNALGEYLFGICSEYIASAEKAAIKMLENNVE